MADSSKLIASIDRSEREKLHISVNEYKGRVSLDLRIFYTTDNGENWRPTQKGVTVAPEHLDDLIDAIEEAKKEFMEV